MPYGLGCFQTAIDAFPAAEGKVGVVCPCVSLQGLRGTKTVRQRSPQHDARVRHGGPVTSSRLSLWRYIAEQFWPRTVLTERASELV